MITVGLVKELFFIASVAKQQINCAIKPDGNYAPIELKVYPAGVLEVDYCGQLIWKETIDGPTSMFGIESCDSISRIIVCIDYGTDWSAHKWEETLDIIPSQE